jgi:hypothetical protein
VKHLEIKNCNLVEENLTLSSDLFPFNPNLKSLLLMKYSFSELFSWANCQDSLRSSKDGEAIQEGSFPFPNLLSLKLCSQVDFEWNEKYNKEIQFPFLSKLTTLEIDGFSRLTENHFYLKSEENGRKKILFPNLTTFKIENCYWIRKIPRFEKLNILSIRECERLIELPLFLEKGKKVTFHSKIKENKFSTLDHLDISDCPCLEFIPYHGFIKSCDLNLRNSPLILNPYSIEYTPLSEFYYDDDSILHDDDYPEDNYYFIYFEENLEKYRKENVKKFIFAIEEELMVRTQEPYRARRWCWDENKKREFISLSTNESERSELEKELFGKRKV